MQIFTEEEFANLKPGNEVLYRGSPQAFIGMTIEGKAIVENHSPDGRLVIRITHPYRISQQAEDLIIQHKRLGRLNPLDQPIVAHRRQLGSPNQPPDDIVPAALLTD